MSNIAWIIFAIGAIQFSACRSAAVNSSKEKGLFDKKLATCRVVELNQTLFNALKDSIKLESISNQNEKPTEVQTVQIVKPLSGPRSMRIGDTILHNAAPFKTDDTSLEAFGVDSLNQPIGYVLIIRADKSGTLGYYENAQLRYGHRPQDISKVFAKIDCE